MIYQALYLVYHDNDGNQAICCRLNPLMRFYDPKEGTVLIDGRDVKSFPHDELRSRFGVAFQNDFIMEGSVEDNIRFFRPLDEDAIIRASEDAQDIWRML